jgi:hypothetical protein
MLIAWAQINCTLNRSHRMTFDYFKCRLRRCSACDAPSFVGTCFKMCVACLDVTAKRTVLESTLGHHLPAVLRKIATDYAMSPREKLIVDANANAFDYTQHNCERDPKCIRIGREINHPCAGFLVDFHSKKYYRTRAGFNAFLTSAGLIACYSDDLAIKNRKGWTDHMWSLVAKAPPPRLREYFTHKHGVGELDGMYGFNLCAADKKRSRKSSKRRAFAKSN